jgi:hypothetical protein
LPADDHEVFDFDQVLEEERRYIKDVRRKTGSPNGESAYVGLALSGGGIRSATFQLGVLQALATKGILPLVDYISAVSGGGFTCGWLMRWLRDSRDHSAVMAGLRIAPSQVRPPRIRWLYRYSNYLTPRASAFSHDSFLFVTTYFHHFLFNLTILFFTFAFLLMLPRVGVGVLFRLQHAPRMLGILGGILASSSIFLLFRRLLYDGKPSNPFKWPIRILAASLTALLVLLNGIGAPSQALRLLTASVALVPVLARNRDLPILNIGSMTLSILHILTARRGQQSLQRRLRMARWFLSFGISKRTFNAAFAAFVSVCLFFIVDTIKLFPDWTYTVIVGAFCALLADDWFERGTKSRRLRRFIIVIPAFVSAFAITAYMYVRPDSATVQKVWIRYGEVSERLRSLRVSSVVTAVLVLSVASLGVLAFARSRLRAGLLVTVRKAWVYSRTVLKHGLASVGAVAFAALLAFQYPDIVRFMVKLRRGAVLPGTEPAAFLHSVVFVSTFSVLVGTLTFSFAIGMLGSLVSPYKRERLMASYATMYQCIGLWLLASLTAFYAPGLIHAAPMSVRLSLTSIWALCAWASFSQAIPRVSNSWFVRAAVASRELTPYPFTWGFFVLAATWDSAILKVSRHGDWNWNQYFSQTASASGNAATFIYALALGLVAAFFAARFGLNGTSMHLFYQARVARAYLAEELPGSGAALPSRDSDGPVLRPPSWLQEYRPGREYWGPYPIFNAALNLTGGSELALQERKAASFIFSPLFCGYDARSIAWHLDPDEELKGESAKSSALYDKAYARTAAFKYGGETGVRLATAMSVSGSAIGSNMGFLTTPRVRFIHTLFNIRLGWWFANPRYRGAWNTGIPRQRVNMLLSEFFGWADDTEPYVHLSDGGHFEDLGLYELVKRKCRVIIISDASEDRGHCLDSLAKAIERCRLDLRVEIDLRLADLVPNERGVCRGFACGTVSYGGADGVGSLVYLRSALIANLPHDLMSRRISDAPFPGHPTTKQWFTESRFESYRELGCQVAAAFAAALGSPCGPDFIAQCEALCSSQARCE